MATNTIFGVGGYDPTKPNDNVVSIEDVPQSPEQQLREGLVQMWDAMAAALPVLQRAELRQVKITVTDALDAGALDEAAALIGAQTVPPEFATTQAQAVAMLNAAAGGAA